MRARWSMVATAVALVVAVPGLVVTAPAGVGAKCDPKREPTLDLPYRKVKGADAGLTSLDVYPAPRGCRNPVVVWVHGGGWRVGDKSQGQRDKIRLFNDLGYTYVSVNYRLTDPAAPAPVRFPVHEQDVAAAVAWVHDHIGRYGGDPGAIALLGHSAGAEIAALLATDERFLGRHDLGLDVIACVAPLDTEGFDVAESASSPGRLGVTYRTAFGDDPAVWTRASALEHVEAGKQIPDTLLVERGLPRRRARVAAFAQALRDAGVEVTTVDAGGYTHGDVSRRIGVEGETVVTPALTRFLDGCLAGSR